MVASLSIGGTMAATVSALGQDRPLQELVDSVQSIAANLRRASNSGDPSDVGARPPWLVSALLSLSRSCTSAPAPFVRIS